MWLMWVWLAPSLLMSLLLVAAWLEGHVVSPDERARAITGMLARANADEIEREVARLLKPLDPPARPRPAAPSP